jgi:outer membrane protein OmpA-like peptidoglycan-associated protein
MSVTGRFVAFAAIAVLTAAGPAWAQGGAPAYTTEQIIDILKPDLGATRSLSPGTGATPPPGEKGSGVLPSLEILFPFNSAVLEPDTTRQLDLLGNALQSNELVEFHFEIAGHTDAAGPDGYNDGLSERRAAAVTGYLEQAYGIDPSRLQARGYGKRQLFDPANPTSATNRRVEVIRLQ